MASVPLLKTFGPPQPLHAFGAMVASALVGACVAAQAAVAVRLNDRSQRATPCRLCLSALSLGGLCGARRAGRAVCAQAVLGAYLSRASQVVGSSRGCLCAALDHLDPGSTGSWRAGCHAGADRWAAQCGVDYRRSRRAGDTSQLRSPVRHRGRIFRRRR
eukprot:3603161-Prymnesium_polylepis.3